MAATEGDSRTSLTFILSAPSVECGPEREGHEVIICIYVSVCACVCGSRESTSGIIPQVPPTLFETGSLIGPVLTS